ncbi:hypothetical protein FQN55_000255 [Onygenales sp. PD_40]|nr:hypothetical protein FQN55_000255 [Onygenales sp. PD_40]
MAIYGDSLLRPQPPDAQSGSPRRRSELSLLDHPLVRRRSGNSANSVAASSANCDEKASIGRCSQDRHSNRSRAPSRGVSAPPQSRIHIPSARTVPAWVRLADDIDETPRPSNLPPSEPTGARIAQHNFAPHDRQRNSYTDHGFRDLGGRESRWKTFAKSTAYPRSQDAEQKLVDHDWLNQHLGDYSEPWQGYAAANDLESGHEDLDFNQRRKRLIKRIQNKILRSPMVPLIIRLTVFIFCVIALALGGSIHYYEDKYEHPQGPSAEMAIVVDAVALAYLVYITYDEYTGKPLGLRPPKAKMRLIFLDLIFIVFASANLGMAFESLSDVTSSCQSGEVNKVLDPRNDTICDRQKALASVLLIVLIAWLMTFAISVLRLVERVSSTK